MKNLIKQINTKIFFKYDPKKKKPQRFLFKVRPKILFLVGLNIWTISTHSGSRKVYGCGGGTRTPDLKVMSLVSYHCSTPRFFCKVTNFFHKYKFMVNLVILRTLKKIPQLIVFSRTLVMGL